MGSLGDEWERRYAESMSGLEANWARAPRWTRRLRRVKDWVFSLFTTWWMFLVVVLMLRLVDARPPELVVGVAWIAAAVAMARTIRRSRA